MMVFMLYAPHFLTDGTHTGTILNGIVSKNVKKRENLNTMETPVMTAKSMNQNQRTT